MNHFLSADSIVPGYTNPQNLNRYAYVLNNPVRYNDPTGHKWDDCGDRSGYRCQIHMKHVGKIKAQWVTQQIKDLEKRIKDIFAWNLIGNWSLAELQTIYATGLEIEKYVDGISNGKGRAWMLRIGGGTNFSHCNVCERSYSIPVIGILFEKGWDARKDSHQLLAHEFAHQWDINTGFSASQELQITYNQRNAPWDPKANRGYGNTNSREYLAEAFSYAIYDSTQAPAGVVSWLNDRILYEASFLP
jgi:hypothetical protein